MKFTLSWLKEHLDTDAPLETILDTLNRIGLEVESVQDPAKTLGGFTIAHVIEAKQHPNADRLRVCTVDTGAGAPLQVVCGAPNARTGMKSVFSPPGTFIPGKNITIGKGVIRGVESAGMLCSAAELQLSEDHDGIIDLPENAPVGARYIDWAGLGDPVIEINLTPNRADAAGVHGIARDLAAAGIGKLRKDGVAQVPGAGECPVRVTLDFAEADRHLCPAFALRLVRGVKNGPSPDWLQRRLKAIGLRPINALVDMTNFLTFDRGRPLHVFDAAKVKGHLTVKKAEGGEVLEGLNGKTYTLEAGMVAIFDAEGVESLGGIMGGTATGCDETTTDVLIESALWDPADIARTGRKLGIVTDARYRFERGVDANFNLPGLELATRMVLDLCGGSASAVHLAGEIPETERIVDFPLSETRRLTGLELPLPEVKAILTGLGFWVSGNGPVVKVAVPSWRGDIEGKADIVEEITRIAGLDRVPAQPIQRIDTVHPPVLTLLQQRMRRGRRALAARGLMEAVTWSFVSEADARLFGTPDNRIAELKLANPIAAELSDMRPSLMPGLLRAAQRNADRGYGDVALFELGQVFESDGETGQRIAASGVRRGLATPAGLGRDWQGDKAADVFDAKGDVLALLAALGVPTGGLKLTPGGRAFLHPGRSATLSFGPKTVIGWFGELHPRTLEALGVEGPIVAFEIILDGLPPPKARPTRVKPKLALADLQPVRRDFAFIVDEAVPAETLLQAARTADRALITEVALFDVYAGKGVEPGKRSLAVAVTLQPREATLTDAEIEAVGAAIVASVQKVTGAVLRG